MLFYFIPPRNVIELSDFRECWFTRFTYFLQAANTKNYEEIAGKIIVDSDADHTGHFILKCFCVHKPELRDFIMQRETDLFLYRLDTTPWEMKEELCRKTIELIRQVQNIKLFDPIRQTTEKPSSAEFLWSTLTKLCETLLIPKVQDHLSKHCDINCKDYVQKELFTHHYEFGLLLISSTIFSSLKSDSRWTEAFAKLSKLYDSFMKSGLTYQTQLTARQIDREKCYFPPCMSHLLTELRNHHRLTHIWRYYFSLFLKDIGLNMDESIKFWEHEYSKPCTAESSCTHTWQLNRRKYLYNIRHTYGLVGARKKQDCPSCLDLQDMTLGMREEGGCPFVHFDDTNLLALLSKKIGDDSDTVKKILEQRTLKNPVQACRVYQVACARKYRLQISPDNFKSPVEYYKCMKVCFNDDLDW